MLEQERPEMELLELLELPEMQELLKDQTQRSVVRNKKTRKIWTLAVPRQTPRVKLLCKVG